MNDFPGLFLEVDPHDVPKGAAEYQVNVTSEDLGVLRSRAGIQICTFEA